MAEDQTPERDAEIKETFAAQCKGLPLLTGELETFADSLRKATLTKLREQYADAIAENLDGELRKAEEPPEEPEPEPPPLRRLSPERPQK